MGSGQRRDRYKARKLQAGQAHLSLPTCACAGGPCSLCNHTYTYTHTQAGNFSAPFSCFYIFFFFIFSPPPFSFFSFFSSFFYFLCCLSWSLLLPTSLEG